MLHNSSLCDINKIKAHSTNKKLSVLAVENEESTLMALSLFVKTIGHDFTGTTCCEDALTKLGEQDFDIALVDYQLPGKINGDRIIKKIKEFSANTHCFLVTGNNHIENLDTSIDLIGKPLTNQKLNQIFNLGFT